MTSPTGDYWVFGYGSLMWDPGFPFVESLQVRLSGWHRRFCLWSQRYRGTVEQPGLVLGLDRGGCCQGVAFRVAPEEVAATRDYLWEREMGGGAYEMRQVRVTSGERALRAEAFIVKRDHGHYTGRLSPDCIAALIATSMGTRGPNRAYLDNTLCHLRSLGIADPGLEELARNVAALDPTLVTRPPHPPLLALAEV